MLARIREAIDERSSILHSRALVTQLRAFGESDSGKLEALAGKDDLLFAFGIACAVWGEEHYHVETEPVKARLTRERLRAAGIDPRPLSCEEIEKAIVALVNRLEPREEG